MDAVYLQNRYRRLFNIRFRNGVHYVSGPRLVFGSTADARGFYHSFSPDKKLTLQKLCRTTSPNAVVAALQRGQLKVYLPRGAETVGISLLRTAIRPVLAAIIAHEKTDAMAFFLVCSKDAGNVGAVHERLHRLIRTQLETSWYKCWEDPRAWHGRLRDRLEAVGYKVLVDALGFDAGRVHIAMIAEAYEVALLICDHDETRVALECFLRGYSRFQHGLNTTQFTGGALFNVILTAVLVMLTGRAGVAGTATGRQPPVVRSLTRLGCLLQDLAEQLKHVKLLGPMQQAVAVAISSTLADYAIEEKVPKPSEPPRRARVDTVTMLPGKDVPDRAPLIKSESGGTLIFHENLDGHTIRRHVGKTDDQLLQRFEIEPDILGSSTYPDLETAQRAVGDVLSRNRNSVQDWLVNSPKPRLPLNETLDYEVGRVIPQGATVSQPSNKSFVLLVKDPLAPNGYRVHTSFPKPSD